MLKKFFIDSCILGVASRVFWARLISMQMNADHPSDSSSQSKRPGFLCHVFALATAGFLLKFLLLGMAAFTSIYFAAHAS